MLLIKTDCMIAKKKWKHLKTRSFKALGDMCIMNFFQITTEIV